MTTLPQTPSQTVGPYFAYGLTAEQYGYANTQIASGKMADRDVPGQHIRVMGQVFDAERNPVPDAMIELWQADSEGRIPGPGSSGNSRFTGFGRQGTGVHPHAWFQFETVKPGKVDAEQAPHIVVLIFMRGLLTHLYTRIYFCDETDANALDPVLASVPEDRRTSLIAYRQPEHEEDPDVPEYFFHIHLQGISETVFFDV